MTLAMKTTKKGGSMPSKKLQIAIEAVQDLKNSDLYRLRDVLNFEIRMSEECIEAGEEKRR